MDFPDAVQTAPTGRRVSPETLAVAPEVLQLNLADPWRRLVAMLIDLLVIGALSFLSGPFLGLATGILLIVLMGNKRSAPFVMRIARWVCRLLGAGVVGVAVLSLGHSSLFNATQLELAALQEKGESPALQKTVYVPDNANFSQVMRANHELQSQVDDLKTELRNQKKTSRSWTGQAVALTGALGVTFGWAGVYFTLLAGLFNGRTAGKLLLGIRAAKINGATFTFFDAFVRQGGYVAGVAMGALGFLKLLWEPNRQAVEDRIAGTVVVRN